MQIDKKLPVIYILNKVKIDLMFVLLIGLTVYYATTYNRHLIPEMPIAIPAFLGTAISVLLSFKVSQSYDRWWEARKVWGAIVNDSRSLVIQLQTFINDKNDPAIRDIAYRQIAWCYSLGQSLRGLNALEGTNKYLPEEEISQLAGYTNKPLGMLQLTATQLGSLNQNNKLDDYKHVQIDATLVRLCDAMGKAERINGTVFPTTYRMFLHFFIYLFVITLSISLKNINVLYELPLLVVLSLVFFLLEKTAYHLQDPFRNRPSDTPVTAIARNIEINIRQLLGEKEVPQAMQPKGFYLM